MVFWHTLKNTLRYIFIFLGLLSWGCTFSQDFPIIKYTTRDGLVQNQVLCLLKDSRGYLWCGTWDGVSKFNGESFENFTAKDGLWNGAVNGIQEDKKGNIWFLNITGKLACFDGKSFKKYKSATNFQSDNIIIDNQNNIQALGNGQLMQVIGDSILPITLPSLSKLKINNACYHSPSGSYVLQSGNKLYSYQQGRLTALGREGVWGIRGVIHGEVHLEQTFPNGDVKYYFWNGLLPVPYVKLGTNGIIVLKSLPYDMILTQRESHFYLPANSLHPEGIDKNLLLAGNQNFLNQPPSSILWLPTEKGLWGLARNGFKNFSEEQVPNTWSVVEEGTGNYLFLNFRTSVQQLDGKYLRTLPRTYNKQMIQSLKRQKLPASSLVDNWYYRAVRDKNGACWLPEANGLFRYMRGNWDYVRANGKDAIAFCIAEDTKRNKIVCASSQHFYTVETTSPFRTDSIRGTSSFWNRLLLCTVVAPNGNYWFSGLGIEKYNPDTKQFVSYNQANGKLPTSNSIRVLYFDWNGTLWAGGRDGLFRYNPALDCFEQMLPRYFSQRIQLIEQIDATHLMIATSYNLYMLDVKKFNQTGSVVLKSFNHHNGFMGLEPGQLGSYRDTKGLVWITSGSVLSVLDPTKLDLKVRPLRTFITQINQERVSFVNDNEPIELPFGENNITVRVESIGEDKPFRSQFSYRFLDETEKWSDWQEQTTMNFSHLANGTHTLQVRSRTGTLESTKSSITTVLFITSVYFWNSPNFYLSASLIGFVLLLGITFLWWRDRQNNKNLLAQQKQLEDRERQMRLLQAQTIQSQMNPHFTSNALSAIQRLILKQDSERASDNLIKMGRLTRAYLEDSLFKEEQAFDVHRISLSREIGLLKMYVELMQLQYENRFEFILDIQGSLNTDNHRLPPFLIQPFVENAIVHGLLNQTEKGTLHVQFLSLPDETLVCKVEDDGIGREAAQELQRNNPKEYTSVSTALTHQRKELLNRLGYNIQINVEDRLIDTGTVATIQIGYG